MAGCAAVSVPGGSNYGSLACDAAALHGSVGWEAGGGVRFGDVAVANRSSSACTVRGWPTVRVELRNGHTARLRIHDTAASIDRLVGRRGRTLLIPVGEAARAGITWTNWCSAGGGSGFSFLLGAPAWRGKVRVRVGSHGPTAPPCLNSSQPSQLFVTPFQTDSLV
ncbi:MAG: DUF4232 domain-containing protein [Chloroflexota bacterium]